MIIPCLQYIYIYICIISSRVLESHWAASVKISWLVAHNYNWFIIITHLHRDRKTKSRLTRKKKKKSPKPFVNMSPWPMLFRCTVIFYPFIWLMKHHFWFRVVHCTLLQWVRLFQCTRLYFVIRVSSTRAI